MFIVQSEHLNSLLFLQLIEEKKTITNESVPMNVCGRLSDLLMTHLSDKTLFIVNANICINNITALIKYQYQ